MTCYVYILQSVSSGKCYIGSTNDFEDRLKRHNEGRSKYTKNRGPWELVYKEEHPDRSSAVRREKEIKSRKRKKYIETLIAQFNSG
jgi:putative endonuclease